ncbi:hypothetical protein [uncultured Devosia sp.]|uniref:hypothetical protein n=1 Tax=uncultured Devosia sp. TaxID=211434 RepID=UPI002622FF00|nr:hypothetical protein [uncultured Devosia sp.]
MANVSAHMDLPSRLETLLFSFLHAGKGKLSKRAREKEFQGLSDDEVSFVESAYVEAFAWQNQPGNQPGRHI